jgi:epoxyqueuosine reductase
MDCADLISKKARSLGFDAVGFAAPEAIAEAGERLESFIGESRHGDMYWLAERLHERSAPANLWPDVRSVVALGMNYGPEADPLENLEKKEIGNLSVYARGKDYHDVLKKRLKALGRWMAEELDCQVKVFVDTAPVMEKPLAEAAGIGWQGKHTNLVSREYGSWLFLGAIYTTLEIPPLAAHTDHCGDCRACLDICPTNAFTGPYRIDARRCISYLTIEHKGPIAPEFRPLIGNRIYGCDDCLAVCPWNKFARTASEASFHAKADLETPKLSELLDLDDAAFRIMFRGSPIKRTGRDRFLRNVLIAAGNSGDARLVDRVARRLGDVSPLVRGMAVWAFRRLASEARWSHEKARLESKETDGDVKSEWAAG